MQNEVGRYIWDLLVLILTGFSGVIWWMLLSTRNKVDLNAEKISKEEGAMEQLQQLQQKAQLAANCRCPVLEHDVLTWRSNVAVNFVKREELQGSVDRIEARMDLGFKMIQETLQRMEVKIDQKADKSK